MGGGAKGERGKEEARVETSQLRGPGLAGLPKLEAAMVRGAILTMSGNPLGAVISSDVTIFHEFHHSSPKPGIGIWPQEELPPSIYNRSRAAVCSEVAGSKPRATRKNSESISGSLILNLNLLVPRFEHGASKMMDSVPNLRK